MIEFARRPNFFVLGAPKSGTSSLSHYLAAHPDILFSDPEEPHFFNDDCRPVRPLWTSSHRSYSWESYSECFAHGNGRELAVGEGTVFYLYSKHAVPNILETCPNSKFIVMLRNPVEAAYSWHWQALFTFGEDVQDFESAWRLQQQRKTGRCLPRGYLIPDMFQYGPIYRYGEQLKRLFDLVPRELVHVIIYDDFSRDAESSYRDTLEFLGLKNHSLSSYPRLNASKRHRSAYLANILRSTSNLKIRVKARGGLGVIRSLDRLNTVHQARPPLSAKFRAELADYFRVDIEESSQLLGRDLSGWLAL